MAYNNSRRSAKDSPVAAKQNTQKPQHSGNRGGGKRPVVSFDPSLFIKKVEEQVVAPIYVPKNMFSDFAIESILKTNIEKKGYVAPTPIQDEAIPYILQGRDVVGMANTGTGKTAAFLIPLVNNLLMGIVSRVLIIAPTRELANQIQDELKSFTINTGLTSVVCIGGANIHLQTNVLRKNPTFVIGTPGRLIDLEKTKFINFRDYDAIVLDEVDRMFDMGFIKDITYVIDRLPKQRHSLFFSATMPKEVHGIMNSFLKNPITVSVKMRQSAENVNQEIIKIGQGNKVDILHDLLIKPAFKKVLIFVRTKHAVDKLARNLTARGFVVGLIHGDRSQAQRNKALSLFKTGAVSILLATDVVARGIDIDDITHVINFDLPQTYEDYIHRIGRTGRADKIGQAITFVA
jgi:superfamily II DNA/RNA helicase